MPGYTGGSWLSSLPGTYPSLPSFVYRSKRGSREENLRNITIVEAMVKNYGQFFKNHMFRYVIGISLYRLVNAILMETTTYDIETSQKCHLDLHFETQNDPLFVTYMLGAKLGLHL